MKHAFLLAALIVTLACGAFECEQFGPTAEDFYCAELNSNPLAFGCVLNGNTGIFLNEGDTWNFYSHWVQGFPMRDMFILNPTTVMAAYGANTYSDGVYNFDLNTHTWALNEWFILPNFITRDPNTGYYYVGEREGLFRSTNASDWTLYLSQGSNPCKSFACYENHLVTNIGNTTYYSPDSGQTWPASTLPYLNGYRFTSAGVLYALMDHGTESDGLWRSNDYGATWNPVIYTDYLSCIGPDFGGYLPLGWRLPNSFGHYSAVLNPLGLLDNLDDPLLEYPVKEMEIFPLINTPSFYVLNDNGCYFITSFMNVATPNEELPPVVNISVNVSPNPTHGSLALGFADKTASPVTLTLFDLKGRAILNQHTDMPATGTIGLTLPDLPSGMYLLRVNQADRQSVKRITLLH
jgi:hypothetical protein